MPGCISSYSDQTTVTLPAEAAMPVMKKSPGFSVTVRGSSQWSIAVAAKKHAVCVFLNACHAAQIESPSTAMEG